MIVGSLPSITVPAGDVGLVGTWDDSTGAFTGSMEFNPITIPADPPAVPVDVVVTLGRQRCQQRDGNDRSHHGHCVARRVDDPHHRDPGRSRPAVLPPSRYVSSTTATRWRRCRSIPRRTTRWTSLASARSRRSVGLRPRCRHQHGGRTPGRWQPRPRPRAGHACTATTPTTPTTSATTTTAAPAATTTPRFTG